MTKAGIPLLAAAAILLLIPTILIWKKHNSPNLANAPQDQPQAGISEEARQAFIASAHCFDGCYEPLFLACSEKNVILLKKLLQQWEHLIQKEPLLSSVFLQLSGSALSDSASEGDVLDAAQAWLDQLSKWGVSHQRQGDAIVMEEDTMLYYRLSEPYEPGDQATVVRPCWTLNDGTRLTVLEPGTATLAAQDKHPEGGSEHA